MTLKNARFSRAEDLSPETREKYSLPKSGLVVIESRNQNLREKIVSIGQEGGIREYLKSLGDFKEDGDTE